MEIPTLYLMVGLPGSGKTTLAKQLAKEKNAVRFTPDEWHIFLFGDDFQDQTPENRALHDLRHDKVELLMWNMAQQLLLKGISVILDYGFWAQEQREEKRADAKRLGANFEIYYLDVTIDELKQRIRKRNAEIRTDIFHSITEKDLEDWFQLFQPPGPEELKPSLFTALPKET